MLVAELLLGFCFCCWIHVLQFQIFKFIFLTKEFGNVASLGFLCFELCVTQSSCSITKCDHDCKTGTLHKTATLRNTATEHNTGTPHNFFSFFFINCCVQPLWSCSPLDRQPAVEPVGILSNPYEYWGFQVWLFVIVCQFCFLAFVICLT